MTNRSSLLFLTAILLVPTWLYSTEIRQDVYRFQMDITMDVSCTTFVIDDYSPLKIMPQVHCSLPIVYFELGSALLSSAAAAMVLNGLKDCGISRQEPLAVIGHSCELGREQLNLTLSWQRAEAIASLLQENGFTVALILGRGSQESLTQDQALSSHNRRVEIKLRRVVSRPPLPVERHMGKPTQRRKG